MDSNAVRYYSAKNLEIFPQMSNKKKALDLIKEYLISQPEQIEKLESASTSLYETINEFIDITHNYSSQLEILALKIIPTYSAEGQLAQAVQGIFLFFSEELNILISDLKKENNKPDAKQINEVMKQFEKHKNNYFQKIRDSISSSEKFKKEIESYQEYLVSRQYNEHIRKGNIKCNDDDIINIYEMNKRKKSKENNNDKIILLDFDIIDENEENDILRNYNPDNDYGLNINNNEKEVAESQKLFFNNIYESNNILNNIKAFLSKEKTNIRKNIFNVCECLIEGFLKCARNQKKNFDVQNDVIKNITNILKYEETDKNRIIPEPVKLKYLEIYHNYILEKSEANDKKKTNLTTDDLAKKTKKLSNNPRKNYNTYNANNTKSTLNVNQIGNLVSKEKTYEIFKSMVTKLSRVEILDIFSKIKATNIVLDKSDLQLIEEETNYKIIHEILVTIFINSEKYTEKEKNILINFFEKDKIYIIYFIKVLNDHRTKGNFLLSENTLKYLGELFKYINNLILSKNDMELFKFVFILSMTYYHLSNNMKIYLFSYIKDHPDYQKVAFWDDYLNELIEHDLKNTFNQNIDINTKNLKILNKDEKEKLSNCYFSNFLTAVKAMADFRLDKKFVRDFVEKNKEKYILSKEQIENICMIFDISLNENEANYNGDFLNKEEPNKSNNEIKDDINSENQDKKKSIEKEDEKNGQKENKKNNSELDKNENKEKINIESAGNIKNKKENDNNVENNEKIVNENIDDIDNENNQTNNETI